MEQFISIKLLLFSIKFVVFLDNNSIIYYSLFYLQ